MEGCSQTAIEVIGMDAHSRKLALCLVRREDGKLVKVKTVATTLDALEGTYRKQMPSGALTVLEASTNSFCIAARLKAIGFDAKVLNADVLSGLSRQDRVNDRIDAENLARAYLRYGSELRVVYTPTERGIDMRETFFAYRDARKDATRAANRIWSFCSRHGFDVDRKIGKKRCAEIVANAKASGLSAPVVGRVEGLVKDWTDAVARCAGREKAIVRAVAANADMTRLLQVPGIRFIGAFAVVAFVEDIRRFESPKKFVSYVGLNPSVCGSGEWEAKRSTSRFGRGDLKAIFVEAAQSAMRTENGLTKWARHLLAQGKEWNVAMVALARKLAVLCWHVLMDHPVPSRDGQAFTSRKLALLASKAGLEAIRAAGYESSVDFVEDHCSCLYGHLPERQVEEVALCSNA